MPDPASILAGLTAIARQAWPFAVAWHGIIAIAGVALALGWRPSRRTAGALLVAPLASVGVFAAAFGNPFNAASFGLGALVLLGLALRLPREELRRAPLPWAAAGALLVGFGWLYPHFLEDRSAIAYLYAAPTGLVPCPTLSLVIGLALIAGGLRARAWSTVLAALGLFYGLFGALRLGVWIDLGLTAGAVALLVAVWTRPLNRVHPAAPPGSVVEGH